MNFEVTYRSSDGTLHIASIDATNRSACMAECRRHGVVPMRVCVRQRNARKQTHGIWIVLVTLVIVSVVGLWWGVNAKNNEVPPLPPQPLPKQHIKTAVTNNVVKFKPNIRPVKTAKIPLPEITKPDVFLEPLKSIPTNSPALKLDFENAADEMIAGVMTVRPGERFLYIPDDDEFDRDFEESMKNLLKVNKDDSPILLEKKQAVVKAKTAILEYMKSGERPSAIVREAIEHMNMIADYREKLENDLADFSQHATRKEVTEYLDEANKLLAGYGVDPLTFDLNELPSDEELVADGTNTKNSEAQSQNGVKNE